MLRTLSMLDEELPTLVPDGIYGSATANAVSAFQKKHDLPITGIADRDTHQAIVDAYDRAVPYLSIAEGPVVLFPAKLVISRVKVTPRLSDSGHDDRTASDLSGDSATLPHRKGRQSHRVRAADDPVIESFRCQRCTG